MNSIINVHITLAAWTLAASSAIASTEEPARTVTSPPRVLSEAELAEHKERIRSTPMFVNDSELGVYRILDGNRQATPLQIRVSKAQEKWSIEQRKLGGEWSSLSCDKGCELRDTNQNEMALRFTGIVDWSRFSVACIQNTAFAFCRKYAVTQPSTRLYLLAPIIDGRRDIFLLEPESSGAQ